MSSKDFIALCKSKVVNYFNDHCEKTDNVNIITEDVYVVWY